MDILIVGVGGQGTLLASRVIGKYAVMKGLDCKLSEVHGMSQRGGSVVTHVRFSDEVFAPTVGTGSCDAVLSFELLEAKRYCHFLKGGGRLIVNDQKIYPMPVITGAEVYPDDVADYLKSNFDVRFVPALALSEKAGSIKAVNTVILGAFARAMDLDKDCFLEAVVSCVPEKFKDLNERAFLLGYEQEIK